LTWDERYAPFIWPVGFLPLAHLITGGLPIMDFTVLMALVDRWRLETHTFHLSCGETTVTLQDVIMILGLPIDGSLACATVTPDGWRDSIGAAISLLPPDIPTDQKGRKTTDVPSGWLIVHFSTWLEGAEDTVVQRYARSCRWHMNHD
jgi:hypothetical protein